MCVHVCTCVSVCECTCQCSCLPVSVPVSDCASVCLGLSNYESVCPPVFIYQHFVPHFICLGVSMPVGGMGVVGTVHQCCVRVRMRVCPRVSVCVCMCLPVRMSRQPFHHSSAIHFAPRRICLRFDFLVSAKEKLA